MVYLNSKEKDYFRKNWVVPFFRQSVSRSKSARVLETLDQKLRGVQAFQAVRPDLKIVGITLGDQKPADSTFPIHVGHIQKLVQQKRFKHQFKEGFDFLNLDLYGPGKHYFQECISSYHPKWIEHVIALQKNKKRFSLLLNVGLWDLIPPRKDYTLHIGRKKTTVITHLRETILSPLIDFVAKKKMYAQYESLVESAAIMEIMRISGEKYGYSVTVFKHPFSYMGISGGNYCPMLATCFIFNQTKKKTNGKYVLNKVKKTEFFNY